jgi:hypothetical protein
MTEVQTKLHSIIIAHPFPRGWGNGYVFLPKKHPLHGISQSTINNYVEVHKKVTFAEEATSNDMGFKAGDINLDFDIIGMWVVGFDTQHWGDNLTKCSEAFVRQQTDYLREQLQDCYDLDTESIKQEDLEFYQDDFEPDIEEED